MPETNPKEFYKIRIGYANEEVQMRKIFWRQGFKYCIFSHRNKKNLAV